jgi:hypothetical protein
MQYSQFQEKIVAELKLIKAETRSMNKNKGYWHDGREFIKGIEPLEGSEPFPGASLVKFFANPIIKFARLKGSKVCERKAAGW